MRKRNIIKTADTIFWYTIYLLPVISYLIWVFSVCRNSGFESLTLTSIREFLNFGSFCVYSRLDVYNFNIISSSLSSVFGTQGIFPLFSNDVILIFTWFIGCFLMHLFVDVILFIPRFAMKWMDEFTKE